MKYVYVLQTHSDLFLLFASADEVIMESCTENISTGGAQQYYESETGRQ